MDIEGKSLAQIKAVSGRDLDNQLDENTLVAGEKSNGTFGVFKLFAAIKNCIDNWITTIAGAKNFTGAVTINSKAVATTEAVNNALANYQKINGTNIDVGIDLNSLQDNGVYITSWGVIKLCTNIPEYRGGDFECIIIVTPLAKSGNYGQYIKQEFIQRNENSPLYTRIIEKNSPNQPNWTQLVTKSEVISEHKDITAQCSVINDTITINSIHAYKMGSIVTLNADVTSKGLNYGIIRIPQEYTPRGSEFDHFWYPYNIKGYFSYATLNHTSEFYAQYESNIPIGERYNISITYHI